MMMMAVMTTTTTTTMMCAPGAHVSDAEQQLVLSVAATDDRVPAEHQSLAAAFGPRDLDEDEAGDEHVDEGADVDLQYGDDHADPTHRVNHPRAVANCRLRLERVEHGRGEVEHVVDARNPVFVVQVLDVAVDVHDCQVDAGERQPADDERRQEQHHVVAPTHLDDGCEEIGEELEVSSGDVATDHVELTALAHQSTTC